MCSLPVYHGGYSSLCTMVGIAPYVHPGYIHPCTSLGTPSLTPVLAAVHLPGTPQETVSRANPSTCRTDSYAQRTYRHPYPFHCWLKLGSCGEECPPPCQVWDMRRRVIPLSHPFHCWSVLKSVDNSAHIPSDLWESQSKRKRCKRAKRA